MKRIKIAFAAAAVVLAIAGSAFTHKSLQAGWYGQNDQGTYDFISTEQPSTDNCNGANPSSCLIQKDEDGNTIGTLASGVYVH